MASLTQLRAAAAAGLFLSLTLGGSASQAAPASLSVDQIIAKHVAARGGLAAWRDLKAMSLTGKMDVGTGDATARSLDYVHSELPSSHRKSPKAMLAAQASAPAAKQVQLPFTLEVKRPRKSRVELVFAGKTAVQVYDGTHGWKLRPFLNRDDYEPFTADELKTESEWPGIEDPLVDYAAIGTRVALDGAEPVDGHDAYKLKLTLKDGTVQHIWIDASSFLDVKMEGAPRRMDGRVRTVWIYQRDFRSVQGLTIPFELDTVVDGYRDVHKMTFDKVAVNPTLSDARFTKPGGA